MVLIMTAPYAWAQTVQRKSVMPGFFVPNGALKTKSEPEKLPPVESMVNYQQPSANDDSYEPSKISASNEQIKNSNSFLPTHIISNELPHAIETYPGLNHSDETKDTIISKQPESTKKPKQPIIKKSADSSPPQPKREINKADMAKENISNTANTEVNALPAKDFATNSKVTGVTKTENTNENNNVVKNSQATNQVTANTDSPAEIFARIFKQHWQDLEAINRGTYTGNENISKILADYKNREHIYH